MREILFRGKRKDNGEWLYGCLTIDDCMVPCGIERKVCIKGVPTEHGGAFYWCEVSPESVGQFTGLTDKNGTKIFEGDIIECLALSAGGIPEKMKGFITWGTYGWVVNFGELEPWQGAGFALVGLGCVKDIEIVGNVHDNPEAPSVP